MTVEAFPARGIGELPGGAPSGVTDKHGRFVIMVPMRAGRFWQVYPHQEDRYYPA